ncbi:phosphatidylinositol 3,4,5-trisphosphate 3-phosphatase cnrN-like [Leptopilina heterotoma]|uniref:phosphatidylinositol 3,4,5-trisphosphate 3-phosphatase cnrN-like n=1 Tax=Leptopilina heterotoma TaxID=63436 RepID=UPI001CA7CFE6|nr:phosphatidylinositol 3,4,5-trisphosphate 3-phosphatase cnrN-like [Leptopilina heterotoma]
MNSSQFFSIILGILFIIFICSDAQTTDPDTLKPLKDIKTELEQLMNALNDYKKLTDDAKTKDNSENNVKTKLLKLISDTNDIYKSVQSNIENSIKSHADSFAEYVSKLNAIDLESLLKKFNDLDNFANFKMDAQNKVYENFKKVKEITAIKEKLDKLKLTEPIRIIKDLLKIINTLTPTTTTTTSTTTTTPAPNENCCCKPDCDNSGCSCDSSSSSESDSSSSGSSSSESDECCDCSKHSRKKCKTIKCC